MMEHCGVILEESEVEILRGLEKLVGSPIPFKRILGNHILGFNADNNHVVGLGLFKCGIGALPTGVTELTYLETLILQQNDLEELPDSFWNLTNLVDLNLTNNRITKLSPKIQHLTKLEYLYLNANKLASLPYQLGDLPNLKELYIRGNPLQEDTNEVVAKLRKKKCRVSK